MPALPNILLGILTGYFISQARVDSVWWPHLASPIDSLKSKVPLTARANTANFYRSAAGSVANFDYFLLASTVLLLASFVGGAVQHKGNKKIANILSFGLVTIAAVLEIIFTRPLLDKVISKNSGGKLIEYLFTIAMYHAGVLGSLIFTILIQTSVDKEEDDDDEEEDEQVVKPKSKKAKKNE